jgi:hypothetical protein
MSEGKEINSDHPLWRELRNGLLWHRTSATDYRQIRAEGFIKPNDGRVNRWGGPYACQQLGGVSLFDFSSQPEDLIFGEVHKWRPFLGNAGPVTVFLGLEKGRLPGKLSPYPENKEGTTGNVIPWVEVCHCGAIPISAATSYLLVCAVDYRGFRKFGVLDEQSMLKAEAELAALTLAVNQENAKQFEKLRAITESPEFKARMEKVKQRASEIKNQR